MPISNTSAVTQLFQAIQYKAPDAADLATFVNEMNGGATQAMIASAIEVQPYTQNVVDPVIREYQAAFNRVPDQGGISFWVNQFGSGALSLSQISTIFANSAEFTALYGATATTPANQALVSALYFNVLNRAPDAAGLAYWSSQNLDAAQLLQAFAQSPEFVTDAGPAITAFQNLEAAGTPPTSGSLFSLVNVILTTGMDNVNGANMVTGDLTAFNDNGIGPTLNVGDHINNVNTLVVTDQFNEGDDVIPAGSFLSNIKHVVLDTQGNAGNGAFFDTTVITG